MSGLYDALVPLQSPATARGSVVLVTGASSGIGAATARLFVQRSACVGLMARDTARLEDLSSELGARTLALPGDVSVSEDAATALDRLEAVFGTVTCAVNAAGICWPIALAQLDGSAWQRVIDTNLTGSFFVAREAGLRMRANGSGSIVNLASEMAVLGAPDYGAYCASKAGVIGLTSALAAELAPTVRVNAVCPGPIDTPMLE